MKIMLINGSPRKQCNTSQLLKAFEEGILSAAPGAEIKTVHLYDFLYTGCKSCFACQMTVNRAHLGCRIQDSIHDLLEETRQADGVAFGSPVYFLDQSAQLKAFLERLLYPGKADHVIPSAFLYAMNAGPQHIKPFHIDTILGAAESYIEGCFGEKPEIVYAYDTFQYNDRPNLTEEFRSMVERKRERQKEQFPVDLEQAHQAGIRLAGRIRENSGEPLA